MSELSYVNIWHVVFTMGYLKPMVFPKWVMQVQVWCDAVNWLLPLRFPVQTNTNRQSQLFEEG